MSSDPVPASGPEAEQSAGASGPAPAESSDDDVHGGDVGGDEAKPRRASMAERMDAAVRWVEANRAKYPPFDFAVGVVTRPRYASDALISGYLAMRIFVLAFPLAYVVIAGFGLSAGQSQDGTKDAVRRTGMSATIADSIAGVSTGSTQSKVVILAVGLMATAWAGRGMLHAMRFAHTVPWRLPNPKTSFASLGGLGIAGVMLLLVWFGSLADWLRDVAGFGPGLLLTTYTVVLGGFWWLVTSRMPRRGGLVDLLPGALLFGIGYAGVHVAVVVYFAPKLARSSATYGALGSVLVLLTYLLVVSWLIILCAELNAGIHARRHPSTALSESPDPFT